MKKYLGFLLATFASILSAQQPQTQTAPISALNAKYTNGTAPGYWATAGSGLTLNLSGGTAFCSGAVVQYTASTLTMTASTTNYVYLNTSASCVPAVKTSTFVAADIPVATVTTSGSAITAITDDRTLFQQGNAGPGITLTTTGTSGAATLIGSTLNIPQYSAGSGVHAIGATFDGQGSALAAGKTVYFTVPYACTISAWNMTVDAGTATVDVWKIATGTAIPTVTNTIVASAAPAISTGTALHSTTLTGWTTTVSANDVFGINLKTVATATAVSLVLQCQ